MITRAMTVEERTETARETRFELRHVNPVRINDDVIIGRKSTARTVTCDCSAKFDYSCWVIRRGDDRVFTKIELFPRRGGAMITICAWCPDARERTLDAHAAGHQTTHTICAACAEKVERDANKNRSV